MEVVSEPEYFGRFASVFDVEFLNVTQAQQIALRLGVQVDKNDLEEIWESVKERISEDKESHRKLKEMLALFAPEEMARVIIPEEEEEQQHKSDGMHIV